MKSLTRFIGIDQSKNSFEVCIVSDNTKKIYRNKFSTSKEGVDQFISTLTKYDVVGLETGNNSFTMAIRIKNALDCRVHILNAGALYLIFASAKKTDQEDALKIARFIQRYPENELPIVNIPPDRELEMRKYAVHQERLKKQRTKEINSLHCLLWDSGITNIKRNGLKDKVKRVAAILKMEGKYDFLVKDICESIDLLEMRIEKLEVRINDMLKQNVDMLIIPMSMPGVGPITAFVLKAYLGDFKRFNTPRQVSYHAGLTPKIDSSGKTIKYGHISKHGPKLVRRVMNQAAWAAIRSKNGDVFKDFFDRIAARRGKKIAIVAVARKMLEILFTLHERQVLYGNPEDHSAVINKMKRYKLLEKTA